MKLKFYGHSDDCFEFEIDGKADEWGCYQSDDSKDVALVAEVATLGGAKACLVRAIYDGTWSFAVGQVEDERQIPEWLFSVKREHSYSTALVIDTGEDLVQVTRVERKRHEWVPVKEAS